MNKLKHIDILISHNKKQNRKYYTIIFDNKRFKFVLGTIDGFNYLSSLGIKNYNTTIKIVSKFRFNIEDSNLEWCKINFHDFKVNGIGINKYKI